MPHFFTDYFNLNTPEDLQTQTYPRTWTHSSLSAHGYVKIKSKVLLVKGNFHYKGVSICNSPYLEDPTLRSLIAWKSLLGKTCWCLITTHFPFLLFLACFLSQKPELRLFSTQTILMAYNNHLSASFFPSLHSFLFFSFLNLFCADQVSNRLCRRGLTWTSDLPISTSQCWGYRVPVLPGIGPRGLCLLGKSSTCSSQPALWSWGRKKATVCTLCVTRLGCSEGVGLGIHCCFHWILTASSAGHRTIPL